MEEMVMSNFIFCLIFLQVGIFFIVTGILISCFFMGFRQRAAIRGGSRSRGHARRYPRVKLQDMNMDRDNGERIATA